MNKPNPSQHPLSICVKATALFSSLLLSVALVACSSAKVHVDKGRVTARTFSFLNTGSTNVPSYAEDRKEAHEMIQQALTKNLATRGVNYVPSGGDITVAYLVVVGNNATTTSLNSYFGYTPDSEAIMEKVHAEQTSGKNRGYFEEGTLVIDLLDPHTSKVLQRRSIQAQVLRDLPAEKRATRVQAIVDQALKDVQISQ